jgi:membrane fusion protein, multidrug efflux system
MNKRMKIMIIALIIVFGGIIAFNVVKKMLIKHIFANYVPPAVTVSSVIAKSTNWQPYISAVGNFSSINGVDVNSQSAGKVTKIHFKSGQFIEKDKPLIDIDDSVDQAKLKFNEADLSLQKTEYQRQADLYKRNATASSNVDKAQAKFIEAKANVEKIQATINQKHILAPFSGMLGIRQINLGQYIKPGETGIVALQSLDPMFLRFYLPEQLLGDLHINQIITFSVEQNPNFIFTGKITAINSKSDSNTHTVEIQATLPNCPSDELKFPNQSNIIKTKKISNQNKTLIICKSKTNKDNKVTKFNFVPGMFASIKINQPLIKDIIKIPSSAISYTMYGDSVFIIEKDKTNQKDKNGKDILTVKRVFVTTGDSEGNYTVIKNGLRPNQLVVSSGELKLQDGTRVTINNSVKLKDSSNTEELGQ